MRPIGEMAANEAALPADRAHRLRLHRHAATTRTSPSPRRFWRPASTSICDKPLCLQSERRRRSCAKSSARSRKVFALTHNYTGYPMVKEARDMVRARQARATSSRSSSNIRRATPSPRSRTRPAAADLQLAHGPARRRRFQLHGRHRHPRGKPRPLHHRARRSRQLCAELSTFIPGRPLDDDGNCLIRYRAAARRASCYASQISNGDENNLNIRVYGTKGSLEWHQEHPNELTIHLPNQPDRVICRRGNGYLSCGGAGQPCLSRRFRPPGGISSRPSRMFIAAVAAIARKGQVAGQGAVRFPNRRSTDGWTGMAFIETVCASRHNALGPRCPSKI